MVIFAERACERFGETVKQLLGSKDAFVKYDGSNKLQSNHFANLKYNLEQLDKMVKNMNTSHYYCHEPIIYELSFQPGIQFKYVAMSQRPLLVSKRFSNKDIRDLLNGKFDTDDLFKNYNHFYVEKKADEKVKEQPEIISDNNNNQMKETIKKQIEESLKQNQE